LREKGIKKQVNKKGTILERLFFKILVVIKQHECPDKREQPNQPLADVFLFFTQGRVIDDIH
jgi:hypothetical protein